MRISEAKAILAEAVNNYPVAPLPITSRLKSDLSPSHNCGAVAPLLLMLRTCRDAAKVQTALSTLTLLLRDPANRQSALRSDGIEALLETARHSGAGHLSLVTAVLTALVALCNDSLDAKRILWRHPSCQALLDLIRQHLRRPDAQPAKLGVPPAAAIVPPAAASVPPAVLSAFLSLALCGDAGTAASHDVGTATSSGGCSTAGGRSVTTATPTRSGAAGGTHAAAAAAAACCMPPGCTSDTAGGAAVAAGADASAACCWLSAVYGGHSVPCDHVCTDNGAQSHRVRGDESQWPSKQALPGITMPTAGCMGLIHSCAAASCLIGADATSDAAHAIAGCGGSSSSYHADGCSWQEGAVSGGCAAGASSSSSSIALEQPAQHGEAVHAGHARQAVQINHSVGSTGSTGRAPAPGPVQQLVKSVASGGSLSSAQSACTHLADRSSSSSQQLLLPLGRRRLLEPGLVLPACAALMHPSACEEVLLAVVHFLTAVAQAPVPQHVGGWLRVLYCTVPLLQCTSSPVANAALGLLQLLSMHAAFSRLICAAGCVGPVLCHLAPSDWRGRSASTSVITTSGGGGGCGRCSSSAAAAAVLMNLARVGGEARERLCDDDCLAALVDVLRRSDCSAEATRGVVLILDSLVAHRPHLTISSLRRQGALPLLLQRGASGRDGEVAAVTSHLLERLAAPVVTAAAGVPLTAPATSVHALTVPLQPLQPDTMPVGVASVALPARRQVPPGVPAVTSVPSGGDNGAALLHERAVQRPAVLGSQGARQGSLPVPLTFPCLAPQDLAPLSPRFSLGHLQDTHTIGGAPHRRTLSQLSWHLAAYGSASGGGDGDNDDEHEAQWYSGGQQGDNNSRRGNRRDSWRDSHWGSSGVGGHRSDGGKPDPSVRHSPFADLSAEAWAPPIVAPQLSHSSSVFGLDAMDTASAAPPLGEPCQLLSHCSASSHCSVSSLACSTAVHPAAAPCSTASISVAPSALGSVGQAPLFAPSGGVAVPQQPQPAGLYPPPPPLPHPALPSSSQHLASRFQRQYCRQHHEQYYWRQQQQRWQTLQQAKGAAAAVTRPVRPLQQPQAAQQGAAPVACC